MKWAISNVGVLAFDEQYMQNDFIKLSYTVQSVIVIAIKGVKFILLTVRKLRK